MATGTGINKPRENSSNITAVQATVNTPVGGGTASFECPDTTSATLTCSGTFSAINCTFEGSTSTNGGTGWFTIRALRTDANTIETTTGSLSAQPAYGWRVSTAGLGSIRMRCTARSSGTQTWSVRTSTKGDEPLPAVTLATSTTISSVSHASYGDTTSNQAGNATLTGTTRDVGASANYKQFVVTVFSDQAGTIRIEMSTDNSTFRAAVANTAVSANTPVTLTALVVTRYYRFVYVNGAVTTTQFMINSALQRM